MIRNVEDTLIVAEINNGKKIVLNPKTFKSEQNQEVILWRYMTESELSNDNIINAGFWAVANVRTDCDQQGEKIKLVDIGKNTIKLPNI